MDASPSEATGEVRGPATFYRLETDPRRTPDWRYQRVCKLLDTLPGGRRPHHEEKYVRQAASFIRRLQEAHGRSFAKGDYRRRVDPTSPGLWHALKLVLGMLPGTALEADRFHEVIAPGDAERWGMRNVIEACVLARMSPREISRICCLLPETIEWYERLFYDVRSRLHHPQWVRSELIRDHLLKRYAYESDPRFLKDLFNRYAATPPRPGQSLTSSWSGQYEASAIRHSAAETGDADLNRDRIQLFQLVATMYSNRAGDDSGSVDYQKNLLACLEDFMILTGSAGRREFAPPLPIGRIEPTVSDQLRAAADPKVKAELLAKLQRPLNRPDTPE
jgi:hypothetical protein